METSKSLPGTVNERIGDLRSGKKWSQKELSRRIEIAPSQLSRIDSGETQNVSSDILIKLANVFEVSADYILGLTKIRSRKNYDISRLGLSEGLVSALVTKKADVQFLNRLVEHKNFWYLMQLVKAYFTDSASSGNMARNDFIDFSTATLGDFMNKNPEHRQEVLENIRSLKSVKLGTHEAEFEKIKSVFIGILKDIKKDMETKKTPEPTATAEFMRQIWAQAQEIRQEKGTVTAENMTGIVANMLEQALSIDDTGKELFKLLAGSLFSGE